MIQRYEPAIAKGLYPLFYIPGKHFYTTVKTLASGELNSDIEFEENVKRLDSRDISEIAKNTATNILKYMNSSFRQPLGYCRIDGAVRDDDSFVVVGIGAIEPDLRMDAHGNEQTGEALHAYCWAYD